MATASESAPTTALTSATKRKVDANVDGSVRASSEPASKVQKLDADDGGLKPLKRGPISKARAIRLEQNRKAARESRRRKKVMIEELQRSVIFFSRANGTLKHQNDELSRVLMSAQGQVAAIEGQQQPGAIRPSQPAPSAQVKQETLQQQGSFQQSDAQAVATQAVYESQGFPAAAARAAAKAMNGSNSGTDMPQSAQTNSSAPAAPAGQTLPSMQPGATMQAMANFQQAAAAAMQAAVQGMQGIPGMSMQSLTANAPAGASSQQAYNDTMTAIAMQQAAAAAAAGQSLFQPNPFMAHQMMAWQGQQPAPAPSVQAPSAQQAPMPAPPSQC